MILVLYIQLFPTFVEQLSSNTHFFLIPFENGINQIYNYVMKNLSRNSEILYLNLVDLLLT